MANKTNSNPASAGGGGVVKTNRLKVESKDQRQPREGGPGQNLRSRSLDLDSIFSPTGSMHRPKLSSDSFNSSGLHSSGISSIGSSSQNNHMSIQSMPVLPSSSSQKNEPSTNTNNLKQFIIETKTHRPLPPSSRGVRRYHSNIEMTDATNNRYRLGVIPAKDADGVFKKVPKHVEHLPTFLRGVVRTSSSSSSKASTKSKSDKRNKLGRAKSGSMMDIFGPPPSKDGKFFDAFAPPV